MTQFQTAIPINVLANDDDTDGTLDPTSVVVPLFQGPSNGSVVVNPITGVITYTPDNGFTGTDTFNYRVDDNDGATSSAATVTVRVNDPPTAVNDPNEVTQLNTAVLINVIANDTDTDGTIDPTTVAVTSGPSNGSTSVNATTGVITYTPTNGFTGTDTFQYTVMDNDGATSNTATVTVRVNDPPTAVNDPNEVTQLNTAVLINVIANDTDTDGTIDPTTVAVTSGPSNGSTSVNATTGVITYTPTNGFTGTDTFQYTVMDNDGATSNTATVTIKVNAAPVAVNDPNEVTQLNTAIVIDVLANDTDSDGTIDPTTVAIVGGQGPSNGTVDVSSVTGRITYNPTNGFTGTDTFQYTVMDSDGGTSNAATVTVRVNAAPVAVNDPNNVTQLNTAVLINVLANDTDSDGTIDPTTVVVTSGASNGTTSVNATTGVITYTPSNGFTGTDTFRYTVMDNDGATSNAATVTVKVNAGPTAVDDPNNVTQLNTAVVLNVIGNDTDADGSIDPTTVAIVGGQGPSNGSVVVDAVTGAITYTPTTGFTGTDTFQYTVQDNDGATSNAATVTVKVNAPPTAVNDPGNPDPAEYASFDQRDGERHRFGWND